MKPKITIKRIFHRDEWRYAIIFAFEKNLDRIVRSIKNAKWSQTNQCWHAPADEETLKKILTLFRPYADIDISAISSISERQKNKDHTEITKDLKPEVTKSSPPAPEVKTASKHPSPDVQVKTLNYKEFRKYGPVEFTIDEGADKLIIKFTGLYNPDWVKEIRSYGNAWFDPFRLEWVINWSRLTVDSLSDFFSSQGAEVLVKRIKVSASVKESREEQGGEIRERELDGETMEGVENVRRYLHKKRYSNRTIESYISMIILFFKFFLPKKPSELTENDISEFFKNYVLFNKYSASYQNQIISGVKIYFMLNGMEGFDSSVLGRPKRTRSLPKVFSKDEIQSILNAARNIKHKLLLWIIYSCGLRRSEVTGIRLIDLDRERGILNIVEAKGKIDRFVPVSGKVWEKIDEYIECYHPAYWLFEGKTGSKYSSESVYRVFKNALREAGIKKEVGVHSLRHSYATHLHENGLDIRYIQELLGHKSTRTTEIYTHVSRRNLIAVRSPIEDIDLK